MVDVPLPCDSTTFPCYQPGAHLVWRAERRGFLDGGQEPSLHRGLQWRARHGAQHRLAVRAVSLGHRNRISLGRGGELDWPLLVLAAKDESTMRLLAPQYWESHSDIHPVSVFATSADRHYIVLRADVRAEGMENTNLYAPAYWSYATLTLESAFEHGLPLWFRLGLAEVLSNTIVNASELQFGRPMVGYLRELQQGRYALKDLLLDPAGLSSIHAQIERQRFDAQCWALMQFLLYGSPDREMR